MSTCVNRRLPGGRPCLLFHRVTCPLARSKSREVPLACASDGYVSAWLLRCDPAGLRQPDLHRMIATCPALVKLRRPGETGRMKALFAFEHMCNKEINVDSRLELMKALTDASGVPGNEGPVRRVMQEALAPLGEVVRDNLGSILARKDGPTAR